MALGEQASRLFVECTGRMPVLPVTASLSVPLLPLNTILNPFGQIQLALFIHKRKNLHIAGKVASKRQLRQIKLLGKQEYED